MKILLVAAFIVLAATPAIAQSASTIGIGGLSCGEYLKLRADKNEAQDAVFVSWMWGYISGFNMEAVQPTKRTLPDQPSALAYIDKYCRFNPLDSVLTATNALIRDLGGIRRGWAAAR